MWRKTPLLLATLTRWALRRVSGSQAAGGCYGRALCSYTHPVLEGEARQFHSLKDLRRHLVTTRDLHFCEVCLDARKVGCLPLSHAAGACWSWTAPFCQLALCKAWLAACYVGGCMLGSKLFHFAVGRQQIGTPEQLTYTERSLRGTSASTVAFVLEKL